MPKKETKTRSHALPAAKAGAPVKELGSRAVRYFEAVGRRKTAVARVRLSPGKGVFSINGKKPEEYFQAPKDRRAAMMPLSELGLTGSIDVSVKVMGGGTSAQGEAVRHGVARALTKFNPELKKRLRVMGFMTRDPRMVERKKYGLKKARRAPQWAKR